MAREKNPRSSFVAYDANKIPPFQAECNVKLSLNIFEIMSVYSKQVLSTNSGASHDFGAIKRACRFFVG